MLCGFGLCKMKLKCNAVPTVFPVKVERNTKGMKTSPTSEDSASNIMRITSMELDLGKERTKTRTIKRKAARESNDDTKTVLQLPVAGTNKKIKFDKVLKKIETNNLPLISTNISSLKTSKSKLETPQVKSSVEVTPVDLPTLEQLSSVNSTHTCKTLPRQDHLELHKIAHTRTTTNCDVFKSLNKLSNHQRTHLHANMSKALQLSSHVCLLCKASFTSRVILERHTSTCHNSSCSECERTFSSISQVTAHKQRCHGNIVQRPISKVVPVLRQVCATCKSIRCSCLGGPKGSGKLLMSRRVTASLKVVEKPAGPKPVGPKPDGLKTVQAKPVIAKPALDKPVLSKPVLSKPVLSKPVLSKPVGPIPVGPKPVRAKPVRAKSVGAKPVLAKPVEAKPVEVKPVEAKPVGAKSVRAKSIGAKPVLAKPVEAKPVEAKPVEAKPVEAKSVGAKTVLAKPVGAKTVGVKQAGTKVDRGSADKVSTMAKEGLRGDCHKAKRLRGEKKTSDTASQDLTTVVPFASVMIPDVSKTTQDIEAVTAVDPLALDPLTASNTTNIVTTQDTKQLAGSGECNPLDFLHIEMN